MTVDSKSLVDGLASREVRTTEASLKKGIRNKQLLSGSHNDIARGIPNDSKTVSHCHIPGIYPANYIV
jgi:hypothetical protein